MRDIDRQTETETEAEKGNKEKRGEGSSRGERIKNERRVDDREGKEKKEMGRRGQ